MVGRGKENWRKEERGRKRRLRKKSRKPRKKRRVGGRGGREGRVEWEGEDGWNDGNVGVVWMVGMVGKLARYECWERWCGVDGGSLFMEVTPLIPMWMVKTVKMERNEKKSQHGEEDGYWMVDDPAEMADH